ncbi:MAG: phage tail protein [Phycisphaerae bacterium]
MLKKHKRISMAFMALGLALVGVVVSHVWAAVPAVMTHQGVISVHGERFSGTGSFYFALVSSAADVNLWTNDGTQLGTMARPDAALPLTVVNGVYNVALGATPMPPVPSEAFENDDVLLRIWFDDGAGNGVHQLAPDVVLSSAPYVFRALDSDRAGEAEHAVEADHAADASTLGGFLPRELVPAGAMLAFGGSTAPNGWLLCHGSAVGRTTFADLFAAIGTAYGNGNGSTTFHLPDMRGRFLRGVSGTTANDPNRTTRTASNIGGSTGNNVGSLQADATSRPNSNFTTNSVSNHTHFIHPAGSHSHSVDTATHTHVAQMRNGAATGGFPTEPRAGSGSFLGLQSILGDGNHNHSLGSAAAHNHPAVSSGGHGHSVTGGGDSETRPVNVYVNWIIKH